MNGEIEEIKEVLNYRNSKFNRSHAQIYLCLLSGEVKTGRQIAGETGLCKQTTYKYLNQLIRVKLVRKTKTNPAQFFIKNPMKELNQFLVQYIKKQTKLIEEKKAAIIQIVNNKNNEFEKHWEIRTKGDRITIIDKKENRALKERFEAKYVKEAVEKFIKSLPEENKYLVVYAKSRR